MTRLQYPLFGALSVPLLLVALGCSGQDEFVTQPGEKVEALQQEAATPSKETAKLDGKRQHGKKHFGHRRHHAADLFGAALRHLDLSEDQKAKISELRGSLHPKPDAQPPRRELMGVFESSLKAGSLDRQAADQALASLQKRVEARTTDRVRALNQLHSILTSEQRQALVQQVQQRQAGPMHDAPRGVGKGEPRRRERGVRGGRPEFGAGKDRAAFGMLRGLELSDAQKQQLATTFSPAKNAEAMRQAFEEHRNERAQLLEAFGKDSFDASTFIDATSRASQARARAEQRVTSMGKMLSVLTPEQRTQLAERLTQRPAFDREMRGRARPGAR